MKNFKILLLSAALVLLGHTVGHAQWQNGTNMYNTNTGSVIVGATSSTSDGKFQVASNTNVPALAVIGNPTFGNSVLRFVGNQATGGAAADFAYIQAGVSATDATAKLRFTRYATTASPLAECQFYSDKTTFSGKVTMGAVTTTPGNYSLYVKNGILAEKVRIAVQGTASWADYVFQPGYRLPSLAEVQAHITDCGHLPGMPSAEEVAAEGIDVAGMDAKLLEKIEELTLYLLDMKKENDLLRQRVSQLENQQTQHQKPATSSN